jgi:hypothetical protein
LLNAFVIGACAEALYVHTISYCLRPEVAHSTVALIGINEHQPLTILEGNQRLLAALLVPRRMQLRQSHGSPSVSDGEALGNFRVITGF